MRNKHPLKVSLLPPDGIRPEKVRPVSRGMLSSCREDNLVAAARKIHTVWCLGHPKLSKLDPSHRFRRSQIEKYRGKAGIFFLQSLAEERRPSFLPFPDCRRFSHKWMGRIELLAAGALSALVMAPHSLQIGPSQTTWVKLDPWAQNLISSRVGQ